MWTGGITMRIFMRCPCCTCIKVIKHLINNHVMLFLKFSIYILSSHVFEISYKPVDQGHIKSRMSTSKYSRASLTYLEYSPIQAHVWEPFYIPKQMFGWLWNGKSRKVKFFFLITRYWANFLPTIEFWSITFCMLNTFNKLTINFII